MSSKPVAIVTGASRGIGRGIALELAKTHIVVATYRGRRDAAESLAAECGADIVQSDIGSARDREALIRHVLGAHGRLDLLVNNAGIAVARRFEDTPLEVYRELVDVNFLGAVHMTRASLGHLGPGANILNVSSLAGALAVFGYAAYAPSKFALTGFSEVLRQELRPRGITVSVLLPPDTDTPQLAEENRDKPAETRALAGTVPVLAPETVADAALAGLVRGRAWIVPGWRARGVLFAARHCPGLVRWSVDREIARARRGAG